jgi:hypothetical protein
MKSTSLKSSIKTMSMGDKDFMITDGLIMCPRAGFQISDSCPRDYKLIITQCINNGWLKPVAHVKQQEYIWEKLAE